MQAVPDVAQIPECARWKLEPKHEQTAFNLFVRPHLKEGEEFIIVPCTEANGNFRNQWWYVLVIQACAAGPAHGVRNSKGKYITHAWHAKDTVAERASKILVRETFAWLESVFDGEDLRF